MGVELSWPDKHAAAALAATPATVSAEIPEVDHLLVAGDNLDALKLLRTAYLGAVKLIYIDPPYNTHRRFVYADSFTTDEWLSMIYPRLLLARDLLTEDGAIVVSIGDHESHTLRLLLDEVFGAENHVADVVWQKKYTRANDARFFSDNHEYLFVYARDLERLAMQGEPRSAVQDGKYTNPDGDPRGPWKATPIHAKSGNDPAFTHTFVNGVVWSPAVGTFPRFSHQRLDLLEAEGAIWFGRDGKAQPNRKTYLADLTERVTPTTLWLHTEVGNTHDANTELKALGLGGVFPNPKPTRLIRRVLQLFTGPDDLVLDFFAGSGSTAHAVHLENLADGGKRRSISVQSVEPVRGDSAAAKAGFCTLDEIAGARLRAALGEDPVVVRLG
ncbi:MAG: site-specific DNA-methyltransferase [Marmoricola sp.]